MTEEEKPKKNPGGRPVGYRKIVWTDSEIKHVESYKALGATNEFIARQFGITSRALYDYAKENEKLDSALRFGKEKANLAVAETAFRMAKSGEDGPMTRFWLATQAGWKEQLDVKVENTIVFETRVSGGVLKQSSKQLEAGELEEADQIIDMITEEYTGKAVPADDADSQD